MINIAVNDEQLTRKLTEIAQLKPVKGAVTEGALHVKGVIDTAPPRKHITIKQVGGWKSEKQRRWFFAALRSGQIEVPWRRGLSPGSEDLEDSWTIKARDSGLTAIVGNDTSYGPFVQDEKKQSTMMRMMGWKTTRAVSKSEGPRVRELIAKAIRKALA